MDKVQLSTELVNTIVQYLANRPYIEVAGIIERVQQELKPKEAPDGEQVDSEGN